MPERPALTAGAAKRPRLSDSKWQTSAVPILIFGLLLPVVLLLLVLAMERVEDGLRGEPKALPAPPESGF